MVLVLVFSTTAILFWADPNRNHFFFLIGLPSKKINHLHIFNDVTGILRMEKLSSRVVGELLSIPRKICGGEKTRVLANILKARSHTISQQVRDEMERETEKWSINETEEDEISNVLLCRKQTNTIDEQRGRCYRAENHSTEDENILPVLGTAMWKISKVISVKME